MNSGRIANLKPMVKEKNWFHDAGIKKVFFLTILIKLTALIVIAVGAIFFPFRNDNYFANFHYPINHNPNFFTRFQTWDAPHYLYLADFGYKPNLLSNAFYPLFPLLIRFFGFVFLNNHFITGLFLSIFFTIAAIVFLYQTVREFYDESTALKTCLLLLAFPTSFFLGLIYSDSLFLMLATALFYFELKNKKWPYLLCAFLLPLSRPIGIFVMAAVAFKIVREDKENRLKKITEFSLSSLLGLVTYFIIMKISTGDMFSGFEAQNYYYRSKSVSNLFHPIDWFLNNFVYIKLSFNNPFTGFLDRFSFLIYLIFLIDSRRFLPRYFWIYLLVLGLVSGMSGDLTSFMRYIVVLFPIFIAIAIRFKSSIWYLIGGCVIVQIIFILLYSINDWVA